jgi:uncharacterized protein (TIGR02391 family)
MQKNRKQEPAPVEARVFKSPAEIDRAISKLSRRIQELAQLDVAQAILNHTGADDVAISNVRESIREVFGPNSPEFREHEHISLWAGQMFMDMSKTDVIQATELGRRQVTGILQGLIDRLAEKREDLSSGAAPSPSSYFGSLNLHSRIADVANDLFIDGYCWEAVFAAAKALINYVKERSGRHDLDGTSLVRTVFSKGDPILAFNSLSDQTDLDEQEGMMHLFEGAVMAIRNPGGHSFPEGSEQRAMEYISLLSLLAYHVQEAKRRSTGSPASTSRRPTT